MAVTFRSVGISPGASGASCVIVKPAGLAVDDLMVAQVAGIGATPPGGFTAPGGWTSIREDAAPPTGLDPVSALFWKIAVQADVDAANFTFTATNSTSNRGAISAWTGHDPINPINADNGQGNAAAVTVTAPTITPSVADCMILLFCGIGDNNTNTGYAIATDNPGLWDERYDLSYNGGGANDLALALGSALRPETSATGNGTATTSAPDLNVGQLVAIAPVPVPVGWAGGDVIGVAIAGVAKINGIALADITKVNGVA